MKRKTKFSIILTKAIGSFILKRNLSVYCVLHSNKSIFWWRKFTSKSHSNYVVFFWIWLRHQNKTRRNSYHSIKMWENNIKKVHLGSYFWNTYSVEVQWYRCPALHLQKVPLLRGFCLCEWAFVRKIVQKDPNSSHIVTF